VGALKRIAVLGSTGSIGRQTLEVIRALPDAVEVVALTANKNHELLQEQLREFQPKMYFSSVKPAVSHGSEFLSMEEIASHSGVDFVIVATAGKAGLSPTLAALRAGKTVALASKEVLVMAGELILREASTHQAQILPIDSEHSAIWQCLQGEENEPRRLFLTASGGPFYHYSQSRLAHVTPEQALQHPVWKMGRKVTIDSATLMNKGLEVIEAHWLFAFPFDGIEILIHPQSIVHSMVEFRDGSLKAQLGPPDMSLDWAKARSLDFEPVDYDRFPCLKLAVGAGKSGGTYPAVLCAADEVAVDLFLSRGIGFSDIGRIVAETLERHQSISQPSLEDIVAADDWARKYAARLSPGYSPRPERRTSLGIET